MAHLIITRNLSQKEVSQIFSMSIIKIFIFESLNQLRHYEHQSLIINIFKCPDSKLPHLHRLRLSDLEWAWIDVIRTEENTQHRKRLLNINRPVI